MNGDPGEMQVEREPEGLTPQGRSRLSFEKEVELKIRDTERQLQALQRIKELLGKNPELQELLTLTQQTSLRRLY